MLAAKRCLNGAVPQVPAIALEWAKYHLALLGNQYAHYRDSALRAWHHCVAKTPTPTIHIATNLPRDG